MRCKIDYSPIPMPKIHLFHSRKKCERFLSEHKNAPEIRDDAMAQTLMFVGEHARCVVLMPEKVGNWLEEIELLVHEATHCMLFALAYMGENEPGDETMCYVEQAIALSLIDAHFKWRTKREKKAYR